MSECQNSIRGNASTFNKITHWIFDDFQQISNFLAIPLDIKHKK